MEINWDLVNYISLPLIAALIGWFTNWVAVKMLFRPLRPVRVLGITFQGVVPRRQKELAEKVAETVEANLISHRDVQALLEKPETQAEVERLISEQIDTFLKEKLRVIPMVEMFLQGEIANQIKGLLVGQFRSAIPQFMDGLINKVEAELNFRDIVREKVEAFDLLRLERIIYDISAKELRTIELLGGVLGFLVGLCQVGLLWLSRIL